MDILIEPNPILHEVSSDIEDIDEYREILMCMKKTLCV